MTNTALEILARSLPIIQKHLNEGTADPATTIRQLREIANLAERELTTQIVPRRMDEDRAEYVK